MTTPDDVIPAQEPVSFSGPAPRRDEGAPTKSLAQEINERRARVENPEMLRNLRGL